VLAAARQLGVDLDSVCGGRGICGRCQVEPSTGSFAKWAITSEATALSDWSSMEVDYEAKGNARRPLREGRRLGCAAAIRADAVIAVPSESQVHKQVVRKSVDLTGLVIDPQFRLFNVDVPKAVLGNSESVTELIGEAIVRTHGVAVRTWSTTVLRTAHKAAANEHGSVTVAVDLGADFRLDDAASYERWYGHAHEAPELLGEFVYGIPELNRGAIKSARAVAAAGCYATTAILALKPLVDPGVVKADSLTVDAASGVSGAGREAKQATSFSTVDGSFSAYGLLNHRHTAEMEMALGATVLFTPHLVPMTRGILATCYGEATGACDPLKVLSEAYASEPFVHVTDQPPATKWVSGSNGVQLTARYDERTGRVLALSAIDNLGKGAAGQMIQCANLMLGLDETAGLTTIGVYP